MNLRPMHRQSRFHAGPHTLVLDSTGEILWMSDRLPLLLGFQPHELLGQRIEGVLQSSRGDIRGLLGSAPRGMATKHLRLRDRQGQSIHPIHLTWRVLEGPALLHRRRVVIELRVLPETYPDTASYGAPAGLFDPGSLALTGQGGRDCE